MKTILPHELSHRDRHQLLLSGVSPRPIAFVTSMNAGGVCNLSPYSFFNAVGDQPPMVMFASSGRKDSLTNIEQSGEFVCSLATHALHNAMNMSSAPVKQGVNEFELAGLPTAASAFVKPPRVAGTPAALLALWAFGAA